jgi:hypothetical protein
MPFQTLPTLDTMLDLYEKPRTIERFQEYIKMLQGDSKGDLMMPISGFNPMAKGHILLKINELKSLKAEEIMTETLLELNKTLASERNEDIFNVALNLSDDLMGGWTNRFTSDYDSKFRINALVNRKFCTPIFWTSETFTSKIIKTRTLEYAYRTLYWLQNPKPKTLKEHIEQEKFVAMKIKFPKPKIDFTLIDKFYKKHQDSDDYHLIFNFLYGDEASQSLAFPMGGFFENFLGVEYAKWLANI